MKLKNKGITLIALVITIIILLILTGVVLNLTIGENGIINLAKRAGENYLSAELAEQEELKELYKELGIENLPENTKENPQDIGKEVALKDGWGMQTVRYTNTKNGVEVKDLTKVATVYAVSVGNGDTVPVPKNFYYVGGTLADGVIISDNEEDQYDGKIDKTTYDYTRKLKGNQFVWIPCESENYKKTNWNKQNTNWNTTTPKSEMTQIEKYGGFYVARYEAGLASTIMETTETQKVSDPLYNKLGAPQSKAGIVPWNLIDWNNAKKNAESMYNNVYVSSGLITGTQWDVILNTMINKGKISIADATTNSSDWGNYKNSTLTYTGRLAVLKSDSNGYLVAFPTTETINGKTNELEYNNAEVSGSELLTTGASGSTEKYHIFDMAGNLYEWTEEESHGGEVQCGVFRGGATYGLGDTGPACYRHKGYESFVGPTEGFRVVLYIK